MIYVFWSCRNKTEAKKIVQNLLDQKLIACASLFPEVESIYCWEGKKVKHKEVKVLLKTLEHHFEAIQQVITTQGSYEIPEVVQVAIVRGNPRYLSWVAEECTPSEVRRSSNTV